MDTSTNRLNAPFGARCFLTRLRWEPWGLLARWVLMHVLALGAF